MENNIEQPIENKKEEKLKKVKNTIEKLQGLLNKKNLFILGIGIIIIIIVFTIIGAVRTTPEKILDKVYNNTVDTLKILGEKAEKEVEISCEIERKLNKEKKDCTNEKQELSNDIVEYGKNLKENYESIKKELKNCESFLKGFKAVETCKWQVLQKKIYKISVKKL